MKPQPVAKTSAPADEAEIRRHYYLDHYVIIAPKRTLRPDAFPHLEDKHVTDSTRCPFCHNTEPALFAYPSRTKWEVRVIANAYPALTLTNPRAYGSQEVVIDTPHHSVEFSDLSVAQIGHVFAAYRQRLAVLKKTAGIQYVLVFKNDGPMAGASVPHAHSQIIALPMVPPQIETENNALNHYADTHGSCAHCDAIAWEEGQRVRVIYADKHCVAIVPYASETNFEAWVLPRRHTGDFSDLTAGELTSLAVIMKKLTSRLDNKSISFNYFLQESLPQNNHHFFIRIESRSVNQWAGAELGTGVIINTVAPEHAAMWYRGQVT